MERRGEFAAASLQTQSYLEREHNARWAVLSVAHATSGITANVLTLHYFCPAAFSRIHPQTAFLTVNSPS